MYVPHNVSRYFRKARAHEVISHQVRRVHYYMELPITNTIMGRVLREEIKQ